MSKAEKFIKDCTRNNCWLIQNEALEAVEIAREEVIEKVCKYLKRNYEDIGIRWMRGYEADDLVEALKKDLEK